MQISFKTDYTNWHFQQYKIAIAPYLHASLISYIFHLLNFSYCDVELCCFFICIPLSVRLNIFSHLLVNWIPVFVKFCENLFKSYSFFSHKFSATLLWFINVLYIFWAQVLCQIYMYSNVSLHSMACF